MRTSDMLALPRSSRWSAPALGFGWAWLGPLLALAVMGLYLFVTVGSAIGKGALLAVAVVAAPVALLVWYRPMAGLVLTVVLGSIHPFMMLLIYHATHSSVLVKGVQIWKELIILLLLIKVTDMAFRRRSAPVVHVLDLLIILYLAYGVLYLFYPSQLQDSSFYSSIMGLRADMFFLLAYFVGRGMNITVGQIKALLTAFLVTAFIISVIAAVQFMAPGATNTLFEALSFPDYMELQRGDQAVVYVIRQNDIAGTLIPRASSLLLSDLALAFHMMLAVPLAAALLAAAPGLWRRVAANALLLATLAATLLTMTRSAMIALLPLLTTVWLRPKGLPVALLAAAQAALVALPAAHLMGVTPGLIAEVFSVKEASVQGHLEALETSLDIMRREPFGRGLGSAGQVAQRLNAQEGVTNESWYLQIATEMGLAAAALWVFVLLTFAVTAVVQHGRVRDPWLRTLCLGMAGATAGFAAVSATLHAWEALTTAIIFWTFAGLTVRAARLERVGEELGHADRRVA